MLSEGSVRSVVYLVIVANSPDVGWRDRVHGHKVIGLFAATHVRAGNTSPVRTIPALDERGHLRAVIGESHGPYIIGPCCGYAIETIVFPRVDCREGGPCSAVPVHREGHE